MPAHVQPEKTHLLGGLKKSGPDTPLMLAVAKLTHVLV